MTQSMTVIGLSRILVLVPVTVCATISYVYEQPSRCIHQTPPPQTMGKCTYDVDCVDNAYCWEQKACQCKNGYILYKNRTHVECLKVANAIGDPCEADVQCHVTFAPFSECRQNTCQCSDGSHYAERRCYESVGLKQPCQTHHNCYIKDSYCVTGFCACTLKYHPNPRNDGCIPSIELGENCSMDYECADENSRCTGVCTCMMDYVLSRDGKRCLKAANSVGDSCEEDSQCQLFLSNTECSDTGECKCVVNFHQRGTVCLRDAALYERCETHKECFTETYTNSNSTEVMNVDCIDDICVCAKGYTLAEELHDCVRFSDNGAAPWHQISGFLCIVFLSILLTV